MWAALLKSGVHATLAGIVLAIFIPIRGPEREVSPLHELEHDLHTVVAFCILPIFAFANAGISLSGVSLEYLMHPVPPGVAAGLFIGSLVFEETGVNLLFDERLGIVVGSLLSGVCGYLVLRASLSAGSDHVLGK